MPLGKGYRIVVSGGSVAQDARRLNRSRNVTHLQNGEQSRFHDAEVIQQAIERIDTNAVGDYQQKIVHDLLNDIQDCTLTISR